MEPIERRLTKTALPIPTAMRYFYSVFSYSVLLCFAAMKVWGDRVSMDILWFFVRFWSIFVICRSVLSRLIDAKTCTNDIDYTSPHYTKTVMKKTEETYGEALCLHWSDARVDATKLRTSFEYMKRDTMCAERSPIHVEVCSAAPASSNAHALKPSAHCDSVYVSLNNCVCKQSMPNAR